LNVFNSQNLNDYNEVVTWNNKLINKIIKTIDPEKTKIFGNTDLNTQIMLSNPDAQKEAESISKYHNLTIINSSDCVNKLKDFYNIMNDLLIIKTEAKHLKTNNSTFEGISIDFYNLKTRKVLNKTLCNNDMKEIKLPLQLTAVEASKYNKLKESGIDIFNSGSPAFRTNCFSYVDPDTEYDTTLNYRVHNYMMNRTDCIKQGCTYKDIGSDGYIVCTCRNTDSSGSNVTENSNNDDYKNNLLGCSGEIQVLADGRINSGFLVACCIIGLQITLTALLMFMRRNKKPSLDKLINQDCQLFDRQENNLDEYFLGKTIKDEAKKGKANDNFNTEPTAEVNTTRQLKDEIDSPKKDLSAANIDKMTPPTPDKLALKDNAIKIHPTDNLIEGNTSHINNSKIYNNFCEVKNKENGGEIINDIVISKQVTDRELVTNSSVGNKIITMKDYEALTLQERFIYDSRSCYRYFLDHLVRNNLLVPIFFKHSLSDPIYIRVAKLTLSLSLLFGTNAILFVDSYIEQQAFNPNKVIVYNNRLYQYSIGRCSSQL
jgi:hypothetical protein